MPGRWHLPAIPTTQEVEARADEGQCEQFSKSLGQKIRTGDVTVAELLPGMGEALGSLPPAGRGGEGAGGPGHPSKEADRNSGALFFNKTPCTH